MRYHICMKIEIEAKFPGIDPAAIRAKLQDVGAHCAQPEILMKRYVFDYEDDVLNDTGGWVRVRDEGDKITMSYKQLHGRTIKGTQEVEVIVHDFETACVFLEALGLIAKAYQETKREKWIWGDIEITIDTWPWVPTFLEIEGPTEAAVQNMARLLELDWDNALFGSVETIYQMHYRVTEEEIDQLPEIVFSSVPKWLEKRKIKK